MEEVFVNGGPLAVAAGFVLTLLLSGKVLTRSHHDDVMQAKDDHVVAEHTALLEMTRDRDYWREQTMLLLPTTREAIQVAELRRTQPLAPDPEAHPA